MIRLAMNASAMAIFILGGGMALIQAVPGADAISAISQLERLGLIGALMLAVWVLRRSETKKDDQIVLMVKAVTEALTAAATSNAEVRKTLEESLRVKEELRESLDKLSLSLHELPCVLKDESVKVRRG